MATVGDKSVKKLFVTAAIIRLKDKNIQEMFLLCLFVSNRSLQLALPGIIIPIDVGVTHWVYLWTR